MTLSDSQLLDKAVAVLQAGGLVAIPTETVYGLAADAENPDAVRAIYEAKKRPANHPLIVHVASEEALQTWVREFPESAHKLTRAFWPGPLTLVLPRSKKAGDFITGGQDSVAVRCPSHPLVRELLLRFDAGLGRGLAAPSANSFGKLSPTKASHVRDDLGEKPNGKVDLILDGGACNIGIESTILDLTQETPRILREGAVTAEMIESVLKTKVVHGAANKSPRVSGSLKSHYAPNHPLVLVTAEDLAGAAQAAARRGKTFGIIAPDAVQKRFSTVAQASFGYPENDTACLRANLYDWLHILDKEPIDTIFVVADGTGSEWLGILDRLGRAAAAHPSA